MPQSKNPFEFFCKRNAKHPRIKHPRIAAQADDKITFRRLVRKIVGESWQSFLNRIHASNLAQLFQYIARKGGRAPPKNSYSCESPPDQGQSELL